MAACYNRRPSLRSAIPFDKDRNGFVMGEGAGACSLKVLNTLKNVVQQSLLKLLVMVATVMLTTKQHQLLMAQVQQKLLNGNQRSWYFTRRCGLCQRTWHQLKLMKKVKVKLS